MFNQIPGDFNELKSLARVMYNIYFPSQAYNVHDAVCSCIRFQETFLCKHVIGICVEKGTIVIPPEYNVGIIERKRQRGRPKKINKALSKE